MNNTTSTRKRGSGEGSWKKIDTNKWKVTITVGTDINGKQIRRSKTGTKRECLNWYKFQQETSCTDDFYTYAIKWLRIKKVSITQGTYLMNYHKICKIARINNFRIDTCTDSTINKIIEALRPELKEKTLNGYLAFLRNVLTYAFYKKHIASLPYIPHIADKKPQQKLEIPTISQIKELLLFAKFYNKDFVYPLLLLGFSSGMRIGEILALRTNDIDLNNNTININKTAINNVRGNNYIQEGAKTKKSNRTIYVNHSILSEFLNYVNPKTNQLFLNSGSQTVYPSLGSSKMRRFFNKTSFKQFTMHKTRHTFVTLALQHGLPLPFVSAYVGHTSNLTTISVYTHSDIDKPNSILDDLTLSFLKASATL